MSKKIYLCRHAQAEHNVAEDYSIPDAPLTPLGKQQTVELAKDPRLNAIRAEVQLVVSSALKRTLQTTKMGWGETVERLGGPGKVICHPMLQECNAFPCDTGSPREVLEKDPELQGFDLSLLTPDWTSKSGPYGADEATLTARARWMRRYLLSRPEQVIVCIGHGDILRRITSSPGHPSTYAWKNAEVQLWTFDPASDPQEANLKLIKYITAEGQAQPTSSDMSGSTGQGMALPALASSGSFDILKELNSVSTQTPAEVQEIERRVKAKADALKNQTNELQELEARLAAAEKRKAELEAKGVKI